MDKKDRLPEFQSDGSPAGDDAFFETARRQMVESQIRARGIRAPRLLAAFLRVPRHEFVPAEFRRRAYQDGPLPIGENQTISQPFMVATMTSAAQIQKGDKILEIGTGSGYQTAILAELAAQVYSVERYPFLLQRARLVLARLGYENIFFKCGDGTLGWQEEAPFNVILVTAGAPEIPDPLVDQLGLGGRLVIPLEEAPGQVLYVIKKTEQGLIKVRGERCSFVPLIGEHGWKK